MAKFDVVEIFVSINGEGMKAGELAVFVRLKGCNLNCSYCDTKWANKSDAKPIEMTEEQIYDAVLKTGIKNVTLTGGEPLFRKDIFELLDRFAKDDSINVEIETNGSISLEEFAVIDKRPAFTMDYKLPSSNMMDKMCEKNFALLEKCDTVKFVVAGQDDLVKTKEIIDRFSLVGKCNLIISPVFGDIEPVEIVEFMKKHYMNGVRMQLQLHKIIWDPDKRGV